MPDFSPNIAPSNDLNPQRLNELGNGVNQIFDGARPPEQFLKHPFPAQATEQCGNYEVPADLAFTYSADGAVVAIETPFDNARILWTDNDQDFHRYVAARYVNPKGRTFRYSLYQERPGTEWQMLQMREEFEADASPEASQPSGLAAAVLAEKGFRRVQEMAALAGRHAPDATALQSGKGADELSTRNVPYLPRGIEENKVFQAVPGLFIGRVDGSQNHWDRPDFFRTLAEAGLKLENIVLEEVQNSGPRTSVAVTSYSFVSETQCVQVTTTDGRTLQLDTRCYRGEFPGMYTGQQRPMRYTDKLHATMNSLCVNGVKNIDKLLDFYIVKQENEATEK